MAGVQYSYRFDGGAPDSALKRLEERLRDTSPLMAEIANELEAGAVGRFDTETAPDGSAWEPSARAAAIEGGKTLTRSGALRLSIGSSSTRRTAVVGSNLAYARIHQLGGTTAASVIRPKRAKVLAFPGRDGTTAFARSVKHPGSTIPARPYLGVSSTDEMVIRDIIERYLGEAA